MSIMSVNIVGAYTFYLSSYQKCCNRIHLLTYSCHITIVFDKRIRLHCTHEFCLCSCFPSVLVCACVCMCTVTMALNVSFLSLIPSSKITFLYKTKKWIVIYLLSKEHVIYFFVLRSCSKFSLLPPEFMRLL